MREELAVVHGVGQSHGPVWMNECHVEDGFHRGLIEAGEGFPGICRLHLSCGHNSDKSRYENRIINAQIKCYYTLDTLTIHYSPGWMCSRYFGIKWLLLFFLPTFPKSFFFFFKPPW